MSDDHVRQMIALMDRYFSGVDPQVFRRDLMEKDWVIMMSAAGTRDPVAGFSTVKRSYTTVTGERVGVLYTGDTIVAREFWDCSTLQRACLQFGMRHVAAQPDLPWYWFVVCKGYRTFRALPVCFQHFLPHPGKQEDRMERELLNQLATNRFGCAFDYQTGCVTLPHDYALRPGVGDIDQAREKDPWIRFFAQSNPGWQAGSELACLVPLTPTNLTPTGLRLLGQAAARCA